MVAYIHSKTPKGVTRIFKYTSCTRQLLLLFMYQCTTGLKTRR